MIKEYKKENYYINLNYVEELKELCKKYNGYYIFKIDGERNSKIFTISINLMNLNYVLRYDDDDIHRLFEYFISTINKDLSDLSE